VIEAGPLRAVGIAFPFVAHAPNCPESLPSSVIMELVESTFIKLPPVAFCTRKAVVLSVVGLNKVLLELIVTLPVVFTVGALPEPARPVSLSLVELVLAIKPVVAGVPPATVR
jgi:hypothetical protein